VHPELPEDAYFAKGHDAQWIAVVPSARLVVVRLGFTPAREDDRVPRLVADLLAPR
jgi:CubicO group peptidase (beta-lactamase class C family)